MHLELVILTLQSYTLIVGLAISNSSNFAVPVIFVIGQHLIVVTQQYLIQNLSNCKMYDDKISNNFLFSPSHPNVGF